MKKICALFAFFALFFAVSCGNSGSSGNKDNADTGETVTDEDSGTADSEPDDTTPEEPDNEDQGRKQGELYGECYPNATCNKGLVCDEENNICIKDPAGSDSDETVDDTDSAPEQPDNADSDSDSDSSDSTADDADTSDSQPDEDADADSGEQDEPCRTIDGKMWWSPKTAETKDWQSALNYCEKKLNELNKCGYSDWHLPIIDELKMLLKWRRDSQCKVSETDDHLSFNDYWTCSSCCHDCTLGGGGECNYSSYFYDGRYSKLGDSGLLWSSSVPTEYTHSAWTVNFNAAQVYNKSKLNTTEVYVRCVRGAQ